jgi:hypothetical protein
MFLISFLGLLGAGLAQSELGRACGLEVRQ